MATKDRIEEQLVQQKQALLTEVISPDYYDNDLLASCQKPYGAFAKDPQLTEICVAKKEGKITAYAFETIAPNGYAGAIHILVGVTPQGEVLGIRVTEHHETPGLGDKIETKHSNWILAFAHQWLTEETKHKWAVKKDGGEIDQFTGATITPRILINQVKISTLALLKAHQQEEK